MDRVPYAHRLQPLRALLCGALAAFLTVFVQPILPAADQRGQEAIEEFQRQTGLAEVEIPDAERTYFSKLHQGYPVLFTGAVGNVWGRYAARLAMGEVSRELGGIWAYLAGTTEYGGGPADSPLDRLLVRAIGQPLSITVILQHGKRHAPRLDIFSRYSNLKPEDPQPRFGRRISHAVGHFHTADGNFGRRLESDRALVERLKRFRQPYIRLDERAVTFFWAGQETDLSAMIRDHKGYDVMVVSIMDSLAEIADAVPAEP